jgi:hypothetical protein
MLESFRVKQQLDFSKRLQTLNDKPPNVLNYMFENQKTTLDEDTETQ